MSNDSAKAHDRGWAGHPALDTWEDPNNPQKRAFFLEVLGRNGPPSSMRLLDFGCGNATMAGFFAAKGYRVEGLDISATVIEKNRQRFPHIPFHLANPGEPAPFADGSFDIIWSSEVIEHVYDVHGLFADFARLLRPNGLLVLTTPYHGKIKNLVTVLFFFEKHFDPTWQHIRFWTRKSLTGVCQAHDLAPTQWKYLGRRWPFYKSYFVVCRKMSH